MQELMYALSLNGRGSTLGVWPLEKYTLCLRGVDFVCSDRPCTTRVAGFQSESHPRSTSSATCHCEIRVSVHSVAMNPHPKASSEWRWTSSRRGAPDESRCRAQLQRLLLVERRDNFASVFFNRFFLSWAFGQKNLMISFVYEQTVTSLTCCSFFCAVGCQNVRPNGHREKATYEKQFGPLICMKNF